MLPGYEFVRGDIKRFVSKPGNEMLPRISTAGSDRRFDDDGLGSDHSVTREVVA